MKKRTVTMLATICAVIFAMGNIATLCEEVLAGPIEDPCVVPQLATRTTIETPRPPVDDSEADPLKDPLSFPTESSNMVWSDNNETYRFCSRICQIDEDDNILKTIRPDECVLLEIGARYRTELYLQNLSDQKTIEDLSFRVSDADIPYRDDRDHISDASLVLADDRERGEFLMLFEKKDKGFFNVLYILYSKSEIPIRFRSEEEDGAYKLVSTLADTKDLDLDAVGSAEGEVIGSLEPNETILVTKTWIVDVNEKEIRRRLKKLREYEQAEREIPTPSLNQ